MTQPIQIGKTIKKVANEISRFIVDSMNLDQDDRYSMIHFFFVHYIGQSSPGTAVFQKELEQEFNIRRSTASGILQGLEKEEWIKRETNAEDGRQKNISLTPAGQKVYQTRKKKLAELDACLIEGITAEELAIFNDVTKKIYQNIAKYEPPHKF